MSTREDGGNAPTTMKLPPERDTSEDISTFDIQLEWQASKSMHPSGREGFRFHGTPRQLRVLMAYAEKLGFSVGSMQRLDAMSAREALFEIERLSIVAMITRKSPFERDEVEIDVAKLDRILASANGPDPDGPISSEAGAS